MDISEVNKLVKQFEQAKKMMKSLTGFGTKGKKKKGFPGMGFPGMGKMKSPFGVKPWRKIQLQHITNT